LTDARFGPALVVIAVQRRGAFGSWSLWLDRMFRVVRAPDTCTGGSAVTHDARSCPAQTCRRYSRHRDASMATIEALLLSVTRVNTCVGTAPL